MVVGLILEVYQPLLRHTVNLNRNHNAAGIDLIRNFQIFQFALCTEFFHSKQCQVHEADEFVVTAFVDHLAVCKVVLVSCLDRCLVIAIGNGHVL